MYIQRNNFSIFEVPSAKNKKAEARKVLLSILEVTSLEDLNSLYQEKEVPEEHKLHQDTTAQAIPGDDIKFATLSTVHDDDAQLRKTYDDTIVLGVSDKRNSKPYKVIFTELPDPNAPVNQEMTEALAVLEDEVLVPLSAAPLEVRKEIESDEEDEEEAEEKESETDEENEEEAEEDEFSEYDPLAELPKLDLSADMLAAINKSSQGMMPNVTILANNVNFGGAKPSSGKETIQSIEDDPYGFSVVGMDNPYADKLLKS